MTMSINDEAITREIYKHIYSFMPGLSIRANSKMIKATDADDFLFWIDRYESIARIGEKNQTTINKTSDLRITIRWDLEEKLYNDCIGDYMIIYRACNEGNVDVVNMLLGKGANLDDRDRHGDTPLLLACRGGHEEIALALLKNGANIYARNKYNNDTSLYLAIDRDLTSVVNMLLEKGANIHVNRWHIESTPLHGAVAIGNINMAAVLLGHGSNINECDRDGCTPLILATLLGHAEMALYLIDHGADVHSSVDTEHTSLYLACRNGLIDVVNALLEKGVNALTKNNYEYNYGLTSLHIACYRGNYSHIYMHGFLCGKSSPACSYHRGNYSNVYMHGFLCDRSSPACSRDYNDVIITLLKNGLDVNAKTDDKELSPLYIAVDKGSIDMVKTLLAANADVNAVEMHGRTPLHNACWNGRIDVIIELLKNGANVHAKDNDGCTPLHTSCTNNKVNAITIQLLQDGKWGSLPNSAAIHEVDVATVLLNSGAIHEVDAATVLLNSGADMNATNNFGMTTLDTIMEWFDY